jgi:phosphoglucomutase
VTFSVSGVESFYVALKIKGNGEFWISVYAQLENTPIIKRESIVVVKKERREIFALRVDEYLREIYEEMLSKAEKREGAEYYKPSQIAIYTDEIADEPADPIELKLSSPEELGVYAPPGRD